MTQGFEKCPWRKLHKGSNGINIPVKFYLNHGPQKPEIYVHCKYPRCEQHDKIKFNENKLSQGSADPRFGNTALTEIQKCIPVAKA
jgi:hypothetical protein